MKLTRALSIILLPFAILVVLLAVFFTLYDSYPDIAILQSIYQVLEHVPFLIAIKYITYIFIAILLVALDVFLFILHALIKKIAPRLGGIEYPGFEYQKDGVMLTVTAKYIKQKNGFGEGIHEMYDALPIMFQKVFNHGYTKVVSIKMRNGVFKFEKINCDIIDGPRRSNSIVIAIDKRYENRSRPYYKDIPIVKKKKRIKEFQMSEADTYDDGDMRTPQSYETKTYQREIKEGVIVGYKKVKFMKCDMFIYYYYKGTEKPVIAVDGSKLFFSETREVRI